MPRAAIRSRTSWLCRRHWKPQAQYIHLRKFHAGLLEAVLDGELRQARRVFHAIQALFFHSGEQATVRDDRSGGIGVICVQAQDNH